MASDIPTGGTMLVELLIGLATSGIQAILNAFHKGGAAAAVGASDTLALAILQQTATIKGLTIDWTDPTAVLAYIQTLPTFVPIAAPPTAGTTTTAAPGQSAIPPATKA